MQALLRLPNLQKLYCDDLHNLADSHYALYKNSFRPRIQLDAPMTEYCIRNSPTIGRGPA